MPRNIMREFRMDEISGADIPAQEGATAAIMKRATPESIQKYGSSMALTTETDGHQHGVDVRKSYCDCGCTEMSVEYSSDIDGNSHTHPITQNPLAIGASIGHTHDVDGTTLMKMAKEHDMPDDTTTTTTEPTLETVQAENQRLSAIVALSTEERAHFDALPDDMRSTFLGKSADDRRAEIVAKNDADPVIYTTSDGIEFRKSSGEAVIAMAKRADDAHKAMEKMKQEREQEVLEKNAKETLAYLPGDVQARAALLKAVNGMENSNHQKAALEMLKAGNDAMKGAFQTLGHGGGLGEPSSEEDDLDKRAKSIQEKEGITFEQAYVKALETQEGNALYEKSLNGAAK